MKYSLGLLIVLGFLGCKSIQKENTSEVKSDYFSEWRNYKDSPSGFFAALSETMPVPSDCKNADSFNNYQLKTLNELKFDPPSPGRKDSLTLEEARLLYREVSGHPVAGLQAYDKYDPKRLGIGFCFGRAMTVHLESIWNEKIKLQNDRVRKLFAVGTLKSGSRSWRYHVTAIVKAKEGGWWAIDPIMGDVMLAEDWYLTMKEGYNTESNDMLLFQDQGMRFGPSSSRYTLPDINMAAYNNYFKDLLDTYKDKFRDKRDGTCAVK